VTTTGETGPGAGEGGRLFSTHVAASEAEIAAPHDFGFQLRHYVVAPEVREGEKLVEILRLSSGGLVKVDVVSRGTVHAPRLELTMFSREPLTPAQLQEVRERVAWQLSFDDDLRPFYALAKSDPVLSASVAYNFGAKGKRAASMFDALIVVILAQNTAFRRVYAMRANLAAAFGEPIVAGGRRYHASPTPEQLAAAPLEAIRAARVGYRDRYIKGVAEAVAGGVDLEVLKQLPREDARRELMRLPGVGPYTADLALIIGARRSDALFLDVFIREALRQLYFGGDRVPDQRLLEFAQARWGPYQGYAGLYLTTNTEAWASNLGVGFRLRSGALSDPDPP
jgi:3-methyladenine DNA glycosylase/8-oxoguanine DNA glycosylase